MIEAFKKPDKHVTYLLVVFIWEGGESSPHDGGHILKTRRSLLVCLFACVCCCLCVCLLLFVCLFVCLFLCCLFCGLFLQQRTQFVMRLHPYGAESSCGGKYNHEEGLGNLKISDVPIDLTITLEAESIIHMRTALFLGIMWPVSLLKKHSVDYDRKAIVTVMHGVAKYRGIMREEVHGMPIGSIRCEQDFDRHASSSQHITTRCSRVA